ncbi:cupin domain-containing protein [Streptomyces blattellae]|uniref:cupin domain-containing protein n=1 Tax=Streptomyces blattellae TaxID=2569855 RepID=UPI0012BA1063|nr:cupin domain-containing protein [Streptomyces blattellae]
MSEPAEARVPRRVVTAVRDGKSVFASDGPVPNAHRYTSIPGMTTSVVYATAAPPSLPQDEGETAPPRLRVPPAPGETRLMIVTFPPDSVMASPNFDPAAADAEQREFIPGLAELFEPDAPGMHRTDTVDYDIVLDGEIWLELDDGATTHLRQGDIVVQCGTRHAWRNKGKRRATMCFVLVGGAPR